MGYQDLRCNLVTEINDRRRRHTARLRLALLLFIGLIVASQTTSAQSWVHGDSSYCSGVTAPTLTFTGSGGSMAVTWTSSTNVGFGTSGVGAIPAYTTITTTLTPIVATVIATPSDSGSSGTRDTFLITIKPNPTAAVAHGDSIYCKGVTAPALTFTGSLLSGTTYPWSSSANVGFGTGGTGNISPYTTVNGGTTPLISTVIVTPTLNGCPGPRDTFLITVKPGPTVVAHGDSAYCPGVNAPPLSFTGGVIGTTFTWTSSNDVGFGTGGTGSIPAYTTVTTGSTSIVTTVIVTTEANGCSGASDTFLVTVKANPTVATHGDTVFCKGVTAPALTFAGSVAGTTFPWTSSVNVGFGTSGTGNIGAYTTVNSGPSPVTSTVVVTPTSVGCAGARDTFLVTVNPSPNVVAHGDSAYCPGFTAPPISFTGGVGSTTFTWTSSADVGFGIGGTGSIPAYTTVTAVSISLVTTVIVTPAANGCNGVRDTFLITVKANPTVATHGDTVFCKGVTAPALTFAGSVAGTTFPWTSSVNVGFGTSGTGSIGAYTTANSGTAPLTSTVVVTPTAGGCVGARDTFLVTVNPSPNVIAIGDSTYCAGVTAPPISFTGGVGGTTFTWTSSADAGFGISGVGAIPAYTTINTGSTSLVTTIIVTPAANGCNGVKDTFRITVKANPNVAAHGDSTYCKGVTGRALTFTGSVTGTAFSWTSSVNVGFGTSGTGNISSYATLNSGTTALVATVVVTPSANGCTGTPDTFLITVNPVPNVAAHGDSTYCKGVTTSGLTFSGTVAGTAFAWTSSVNVGFGTNGTGDINPYTTLNASTTTLVTTVVVTPSANGCAGTRDTFLITVKPAPNVAAHGDSSYCKGVTAPGLAFTGSLAGTTFAWTSSENVGFGTNGTGNISPYTASNGGTTALVATVIVTPTANGCAGTPDTFLLTVKPTPNVAAHGDSTYCKGEAAPGLTFTGAVAGTTFAWTSSANVGFGTSGTGNINPYTTLNSGTTALMSTVIVTPSANGCTGTRDTFNITVAPAPNVAAHGDSTYCKGATAPGLTFSGTVGGTSFTWTSSANVGFGTSGAGNVAPYTSINDGTTALTGAVIVTPSANGCTGTPDTFNITVKPAPGVIAHGDSTYCKGVTAPGLTFTGVVAGTSFTWTSSVNVGFGTSGTGNINPYTTLNGGTTSLMTTVIVTPSANGCTGTRDTFQVTVIPASNVVAHADSSYCNGQPASAINFAGGVAGTTFTWISSVNVGFGTNGTGNIAAYVATNTSLASVVATVIVTPSTNGCAGIPDTFRITVIPNPTMTPVADRGHCKGDAAGGINFTGGAAGATFTWVSNVNVGFGTSGAGSIGSYTAANGGATPAVATVTVTPSTTGCLGAISSFDVTVNPNPGVATHGDSTYCKGETAPGLTFAGTVAGTTYTWTSSLNVGFGTSGTGDITPYTTINGGTTALMATVVVTPSANGCTGTQDTFNITVKPAPGVIAHGDSTYCKGVTASGLTFTGTVAGTLFTWTSSVNVGFGISGVGNISPYTTLNSGTTALMATVIVTPSANGCTGTRDTFHITVNPAPNVTAHGDSTYCKGETTPGLTFTGAIASTTFAWTSSVNVGFGVSGTGDINPYTTLNGGTTALASTVIVTPSANGCAGAPDTFRVTVSPVPGIAAHGDSTYCKGVIAPGLTFTGTVAGTSFIWTSSVNVGFGTSGTGNISPYTTINGGITALMSTVVVTPSANGCDGTSDTFNITVNPASGVVAHGDSTYCKGEIAPGMAFTGTVAGTTFTWTSSVNVGFGTSGAGNINSYTTLNGGTTALTTTVIVTPSANGCPGSTPDTFHVTVSPTPNVAAHGDSSYCKGVIAPGLMFAGTVAGTSFAWTSSTDVGFGTSGAGNINPYATVNSGTAALVSTVVVTPSANGCVGTSDTLHITVAPAPVVVAHSDSTYCKGVTAPGLTFTGGVASTTFSWTSSVNVGFGVSGAGNISPYTTINGGTTALTTTMIVKPSASGCSGTPDTFHITVTPTPNIAAHNDTAYCNGQPGSAISFAGGVVGTTFTWSSSANVGFGTSGIGNIGAYVAENIGMTSVVGTVIVTPSANGCTGTSDTFRITVNPNPTMTPVTDRVHCKGDAAGGITFTGGAAGATFTWVSNVNVGFGTSGAGSIGSYTAANGGSTPAVATVTVTPSATGCPGAISTFDVTVNPTPNVAAHGDSTYCKGVTAPGLIFAGGLAGTTFTWTSSINVGFGTTGAGNVDPYTTLNSGTAALMSTVVVTSSANGCNGTPDTFHITVTPAPIMAAHGDSTYCKGVTAPGLTFAGPVAGTSFTWTSSVNVGFGTSGTGNINPYTTINGGTAALMGTVIVTPSANGCAGTPDTFNITVSPAPGVIAHGDSTYCKGEAAPGLTFTGAVAGTSFTWTSSLNVGFGTSGTGDINPYTTLNGGATALMSTVVVTPSANGCAGIPDTFLITVSPAPGVVAHGDSTYCKGVTAPGLAFAGTVAGTSITWTSSVNVGFGTSGAGNISPYITLNGGSITLVSTVIVMPSANGCTGIPDTFNITVSPAPGVIAHGDSSYCRGVIAPGLAFAGTVAGSIFIWTASTNIGFGISGTGDINPYTTLNGGTMAVVSTVVVTPSANGCAGIPDTFHITVTPAPNVLAHGDSTYCNGQPAPAINFTGGVAGTTFNWISSNDIGFGLNGSGNIGAYVAANPGLSPVVATVVVTPSANGCTGTPDTFQITVNPNPTMTPVANRVHCNGDAAGAISFTGGAAGATFTWISNVNVGFGTSGTGSIGSYTAANGGAAAAVAAVTVTPSTTGCPGAIATFNVTVNPTPGIAAHGDSTYCKGVIAPGLIFTGSATGTVYTWISSANVGFGTIGTGDVNPYSTVNGGTTALVTTVIVTPSAGSCASTPDTFHITVTPAPDIVAHGDSTYCKGVTAPGLTFTGTVAGTTFTWTSSANVGFGTNGTGNVNPYTTLNGGTIVLVSTVIVTPSANGCSGTPDTFHITVNPAPAIVAHGDSTYCKGVSAPGLTFAGSVGSTFAWVSSVNVGFGTTGTGDINPYTTINGGTTALATTVIVTPSANGCTGTSDTFLVTVTPAPGAGAHNDTAYCNGQPAAAISFTGGVAGSTFNWISSTDVGFGTSGIGNISTYVAANVGLSPVVATVVVTPSANGCIGAPDTFMITVHPNPTMTPVANRAHCNGDAAGVITFTGGTAGAAFTWVSNVNAGFGTSGAGSIGSYTAANGSATPAVATVTVTPSATGCPGAISTFNVTVNPTPAVAAHNDTTYCNGQPAPAINFAGGVAGTSFNWISSNDVGFSTSGAGNISAYVAANAGLSPVAATVITTPSANGCTGAADTFQITVNSNPTMTPVANRMHCNNDTAGVINFTGGAAGATFTWASNINVGFGTSGAGSIGSYTAANGGATPAVATVTVTPSTTGCPGAISTFNVTVNPTPGVVAHGDSTYCNGQSAPAINFAGGVVGTTYTWTSSANIGFGTDGTGNIGSYIATNAGSSRQMTTVVVMPSISGCMGIPDTFMITVNLLPGTGAITGTTSVVAGSTITLSDTASGGAWSSGAPGIATVSGSGVVSGLSPGTATISYSVTNSCGTATATIIVTVDPLNDPISGVLTVCVGGTTSLTSSVPGGTWSSGDTAKATVSSAGVVNGVATGTATISYSVFGSLTSAIVTVNPLPVAGAITGTATICMGSTITLGNTTGGGSWSSGTPGIATVDTSGVVTGIAGGSALISYTVANSCGTAVATQNVIVNPAPGVVEHGDSIYCNGQPAPAINFTGSVIGTAFSWTSSGDVGFGTSGTGNISAYVAANAGLTSTIATVMVTPSANGCIGIPDTFMITVNPNVTMTPVANRVHCNGDAAGMINFTGGAAGATFTWVSNINLGFGTSGAGSIGSYTAASGGIAPAVATVTVTPSASSCPGAISTFNVTVSPTPVIAANNDTTYCNGQPAPAINFVGGVAGTVFDWTSSNDIGFGTGGTGSIGSYVATNAGSAVLVTTVVVTPSANGCTGTPDTFLITVKPNMTMTPVANRVHCNGDTAGVINFTGGAPGATFTWVSNVNAGFGISGVGGIGSYTAANGGATPAVATVTVTPSSTGCPGAISTFNVTVNPTPVVAANNDTTYCNGQPAPAINFAGGVAGTAFNWTSSNDVGFGTGGTGSIGSYVANNTGSIVLVTTVVVTPSANGCAGTPDTFLISVNPNMTMTPVANRMHCSGDTAGVINFTGGAAGATYTWVSSVNVGFGTSGTGSIGSYTASNGGATPAVATVTVTPGATGCPGAISTFNVTVNPTPGVTAHNDTTYCNGQPAPAINFIGSAAGTAFSWTSTTDVGFGTVGTGNIGSYVAVNTGSTTLLTTVIVTPSANGCTGTPDTFHVTVNPNMTMTPVADRIHCSGDTAGIINFAGGAVGATFTWVSNANVGFGTSGVGSIGSYTAANGGATPAVATVTVTPGTSSCAGAISTFNVSVNPTPVVVANSNVVYCSGQPGSAISFAGGVTGTTFNWTSSANVGFGAGGTGSIGSFTATNAGLTALVTTVVVTPSANGCTGIPDTFLITVNPTPNIIAHGDSSYCAGMLAPGLNFTGSIPGSTFSWTSSLDAGFGTSGTGNIPTYTTLNSGLSPAVATVIVTPSAAGCTGVADTFLITVNPGFTMTPVASRSHCAGTTGSVITFSSSTPGSTFTWASSANVGFGTAGTGNIAAYTAINTGTTPAVATVTVTPGTTGCGGGAVTFMVTVYPTPTVAAHGDSTYCKGITAPALSFTGTLPGTTFAWGATANVGFGTIGTGNIPPYFTLNPGSTDLVATVMVTPTTFGCPGATDVFQITVKPTPAVAAHADTAYCNGQSAAAITFASAIPGTAFNWIVTTDVGFGTAGSGNIAAFTATNGGTLGIVSTVIVTPSAGGCTGASDTFTVTVNPAPVVPTFSDITICSGSSVPMIDITGTDIVNIFTWSGTLDAGFGTSGVGNIGSFTAMDNPGPANVVDTLSVYVTAPGGCTSAARFNVTILPGLFVVARDTVCSGGSLDLTPLGTPAGGTWSGPGVSGGMFNTSGLALGTYVVYYSVDNGSCSGLDSAEITVSDYCIVNGAYTQDVYGRASGEVCDGAGQKRSSSNLIGYLLQLGGQITVGRPGRSVVIPVEAADAVNAVLPGRNIPFKLTYPGDVTISNTPGSLFDSKYLSAGALENSMLGEQIAMKLNVRMNPGLLNFPIVSRRDDSDSYFQTFSAIENNCTFSCGNTTPMCFGIKRSVARYLTRGRTKTATLNDLVNLADDLLGDSIITGANDKGYIVPSYADVTSALSSINEAFSYFRTFRGVYGGCNSDVITNTDSIDLIINIYPNPTSGAFTIEIQGLKKDAHVSALDVLGRTSLLSATIPASPYDQKLQLEFPREVARGVYLIRIETGGTIYARKLVLD